MKRLFPLAAVILGGGLLPGCGGEGGHGPVALAANPMVISPGAGTFVSWGAPADAIVIGTNLPTTSPSGGLMLFPTHTTTYFLSIRTVQGRTYKAVTTVTVR